jgi:hypothetical protein
VLNQPVDERVEGDLLAIEGWVLSPVPLARLELRFGDGEPIALPTAPDPVVAGIYPLARGTAVLGFAVREQPPWPPGRARLPMSLTAVDERGTASVIDRRWLVDARPLPDAEVPAGSPSP